MANINMTSDSNLEQFETKMRSTIPFDPDTLQEVLLSTSQTDILVEMIQKGLEIHIRKWAPSLQDHTEDDISSVFSQPSKKSADMITKLLTFLSSQSTREGEMNYENSFCSLLNQYETLRRGSPYKFTTVELSVLSILSHLRSFLDVPYPSADDTTRLDHLLGQLSFLLKTVAVFFDFQFDKSESMGGLKHPLQGSYTSIMHVSFSTLHKLFLHFEEMLKEDGINEDVKSMKDLVVHACGDIILFFAYIVGYLYSKNASCLDEQPKTKSGDNRFFGQQGGFDTGSSFDDKKLMCVVYSKKYLVVKLNESASNSDAMTKIIDDGNMIEKPKPQQKSFGFSSSKRPNLLLGSESLGLNLDLNTQPKDSNSIRITPLIDKSTYLKGTADLNIDEQKITLYLSEKQIHHEKDPNKHFHFNLSQMKRDFQSHTSKYRSSLTEKLDQKNLGRPTEAGLTTRQVKLNVTPS